jgi:hypothetical protein
MKPAPGADPQQRARRTWIARQSESPGSSPQHACGHAVGFTLGSPPHEIAFGFLAADEDAHVAVLRHNEDQCGSSNPTDSSLLVADFANGDFTGPLTRSSRQTSLAASPAGWPVARTSTARRDPARGSRQPPGDVHGDLTLDGSAWRARISRGHSATRRALRRKQSHMLRRNLRYRRRPSLQACTSSERDEPARARASSQEAHRGHGVPLLLGAPLLR